MPSMVSVAVKQTKASTNAKSGSYQAVGATGHREPAKQPTGEGTQKPSRHKGIGDTCPCEDCRRFDQTTDWSPSAKASTPRPGTILPERPRGSRGLSGRWKRG